MADSLPGEVVAVAFDYPSGYRVPRHQHQRSQLVFSTRGVMTVSTRGGSWVLPAGRALWIPAEVEHSIRATGAVELRTVYFDPKIELDLADECQVLEVSALLRELIVRAVEVGPTLWHGGRATVSRSLVQLLLEELGEAGLSPLRAFFLAEGTDSRLRRLTRGLIEDPTDSATLDTWGRRVGASARTLSRLFLAETGLSFTRWRQQLRLRRAMELLALGHAVSEVGLAVGYDSLSAFISAFRQATGQTPRAYARSSVQTPSTGPSHDTS